MRGRPTSGRTARPGGDGRSRDARLVEAHQTLPGRILQTWHAPSIAAAARPGQYVYVLEPRERFEALLTAYHVSRYDRVAGTITVEVVDGDGLARRRAGEGAVLSGPHGSPVALDPRSRHLLIATEGSGLTRVLAVADEALATGRRVVLLHGAASSSEVYPTSLLADEVEYVVATRDGSLGHEGEVAEMVADYEAWADRCIASGPPAMLAALASRSRGRDARLGVARLGRKGGQRSTRSDGARARRGSWLQVVVEHPFGCALGVCLGCVVPGVLEPRACREGPAFAAAELAWERAW